MPKREKLPKKININNSVLLFFATTALVLFLIVTILRF